MSWGLAGLDTLVSAWRETVRCRLLLAAVDAGVSQRQLADRYDCAPSLLARHIAKAKRAR
jgi:hypothetical protein